MLTSATCNYAYGGSTQNPDVFPSMICAGDMSAGNDFHINNIACKFKNRQTTHLIVQTYQVGLILAKVILADLSSYSLWMAMLLKHDRLVSSRGEEAALFLPFLVSFHIYVSYVKRYM